MSYQMKGPDGYPSGIDSRPGPQLRLGQSSGRWVLVAAVLGSGLASIDATVVNIALPTNGHDLHAGFASV